MDSPTSSAPRPPSRPVVVGIMGSGRSGSTLLEFLLAGHIAESRALGEVDSLVVRGLRDNELCSCAVPVCDCPRWLQALAALGADPRRTDWENLVEGKGVRVRLALRLYLTGALRLSLRRRTGRSTRVAQYEPLVAVLDLLASPLDGPRVLIDNSKTPLHFFALAATGRVDLRIVHLLREPHAVVWSWKRRKHLPESGSRNWFMEPRSAVTSTSAWLLDALMAASLRYLHPGVPYHRVVYERMASDPERTVSRCVDELGLAAVAQPRPPSDYHVLGGNPARFDRFPTIKPDQEWRDRMRWPTRVLVAVAASALHRWLARGDR